MGEVEAQPPGLDQRALLGDVFAEHLAQRGMQQVGRRVVERRGLARGRVDAGDDLVADRQRALGEVAGVQVGLAVLLGVVDHEQAAAGAQLAVVAHLAARLGIERRVVEHDDALVAGGEGLDLRAVAQQRDHARLAREAVVAGELGDGVQLRQAGVVDRETARGACPLALCLHRAVEAGLVDGQAALAGDIGGQVDREAVGVVEQEQRLAGDLGPGLEVGDALVEDAHALVEGLGEALLLEPQHAHHLLLRGRQLGERATHLGAQRRHQLVEEGFLEAELVAVADRSADDPAQHVAAPLVGGQHPIHYQERAAAAIRLRNRSIW